MIITKTINTFFIKLGKALMLPVAVLPIAGILLRIGQPDLLNIPFISTAGGAVFDNLALIFALGVAVGFADDSHGAAAIAAFIGHSIFIAALKVLLPSVNMGVLSGIVIGVMAGGFYNMYKEISLPTYLAFFGGRRFVPIITGIAALLLAVVFKFVWPPLGLAISSLGNWIIGSGNAGLFTYGVANRLLIPLGLHHILNSLVWFQFGEYSVIENGVNVVKNGDLWRFFAGDKTAGSFMALFFPVMMFGLPGGALAMILLAKPEKRKVTAGILGSAALTAFLTGITEPIEFSFMFLAFPLYVLHALLTGVSAIIMNVLGVKLGFTFSAGAFDYILSYGISTHPIYLIPVGIVYFVVYFLVFYFAIKLWNIKTLGREDEDLKPSNQNEAAMKGEDIVINYIKAMGGKENIVKLDNCTTRLRVKINNNDKVDVDTLKKLGAKGVINNLEGNLQVIIGPEVELLANKIKKLMD